MTHPEQDREGAPEQDREDPPEFDRTARLDLVYRIVSAVSHDFNNVLATASMYSELLLQDPAVTGTTAEDVREILDAARRGAALTAFLAVLKDSRGASLEPARVAAQLGHVQKILGRLLPDGVRIEVALPDGDLEVRIDRVRLQQAIFAVVWSVGERLAASGGVVRVGVVPDERSVTLEIRGTIDDESPLGNSGAESAPSDDGLLVETASVLESFGGALEVAGGEGVTGDYRLILPRTGRGAKPGSGDPDGSDLQVVVVGDPALERLLSGAGLRTTGVATSEAALPRSNSADAIVGPASRAMFRATRRIRSGGEDARVFLLGTAVDVELPPELEADPHVRLVRAPIAGDRLAELIRRGEAAAG